jgi:hypothetical protein
MIEFIVGIGVNYSQVLTGGVVVLHKLAFDLAKRGHKVHIFTEPAYPHPNIFVSEHSFENISNIEFDPNNTVIIPPFDWKNNTKIKHVARWALYHISNKLMHNIDEDDEIFNFGSFDIPTDKKVHTLTTFDYQKETFYDRGLKRNKKYCHILLKNNPPHHHEIISHFNSFNLDDYKSRGCFKYLAEKFNEYEYFITFDDKTFLTTAAAMCGCKSIILKNNSLNPFEYRNNNRIQGVGVSYGIDDLDWAEKTISSMPKYIDFLIESDDKTIDEFINFWNKKINL